LQALQPRQREHLLTVYCTEAKQSEKPKPQ
jgi:hypothetical protein